MMDVNNSTVVPTDEAFEKVEKRYPDKSDAEKYRLAQAQTLVDKKYSKASA
jgi:hypothetical protein